MPAMRDVFWDTIYEEFCTNNNLILLSADFGAMSLDKYRVDFPGRYINSGISEQNTILIAAGLALSGKKVFITGITPFVTYRCFEQIRLYPAGMNLPITIVGVGSGVCYEDSGPTHHGTEDLSIIRTLPHINIYNPCDNVQTSYLAKQSVSDKGPSYFRLDRVTLKDVYTASDTFEDSFSILSPIQNITIASFGNMLHKALEIKDIVKKAGIDVGIIDVYKIPVDRAKFKNTLKDVKTLITLEEHNLAGGFGSYILELTSDFSLNLNVKRFGFDFSKGFSHDYGGRNVIHEIYNMDNLCISEFIKEENRKWA